MTLLKCPDCPAYNSRLAKICVGCNRQIAKIKKQEADAKRRMYLVLAFGIVFTLLYYARESGNLQLIIDSVLRP